MKRTENMFLEGGKNVFQKKISAKENFLYLFQPNLV